MWIHFEVVQVWTGLICNQTALIPQLKQTGLKEQKRAIDSTRMHRTHYYEIG